MRVNSFTQNAAGVDANAALVAAQFAPLGFAASRVPCTVPGAGSHLVLETGGDEPVIGCVSHLDTVYPAEEEARNDFGWRPEGDRIYGPGTYDIKGGTALLWQLLDAMSALEPARFRAARWIVLLNAAEEALAKDFGDLCLRTLPPAPATRACLVFEGDGDRPGFRVVRSRKGAGTFRVRAAGRGAHSGVSHAAGANAIHQLARVIDRLQGLTDLDRETTVNVGVVSGGSVTNRVPHEAEARLEMRASDRTHYEQTRAAILAMTGVGDVAAVSDGFACRIDVTLEKETPPWPRNPETDRLVAVWQRAAAACGSAIEPSHRGGLSDGNWLWHAFPTIDGLGPSGGNLHTSERSADGTKLPEYVVPSTFVPKAMINYLALRELLADR